MIQDKLLNVKYTDIDYSVLSDAGLSVLKGGSPFDRITYRYSPIYAWLYIPNHILTIHFAKFLMIFFDYLIAKALSKLLKRNAKSDYIILFAWWLNPLSFAISTRGSSDGIPILAFLLSLLALKFNRFGLSGMALGFSTHLKPNAIIYAPTIALAIDLIRPSRKSNRRRKTSN